MQNMLNRKKNQISDFSDFFFELWSLSMGGIVCRWNYPWVEFSEDGIFHRWNFPGGISQVEFTSHESAVMTAIYTHDSSFNHQQSLG